MTCSSPPGGVNPVDYDQQLPTCAVCKRPVDRLESEYNTLTAVTRFVAVCHGARQVVDVTVQMLVAGLSFGLAFDAPVLPSGEP